MLRKGKGKEARLVFMAHALMENRRGMLVDLQTTQATGTDHPSDRYGGAGYCAGTVGPSPGEGLLS